MAYAYRRDFTIDHTLNGSADSTDFPVLISGTYSWLATIANGGRVQNGNDKAWFADTAMTTPLDFEEVVYNAVTGFIEHHVRVPTLHHSTDDVLSLGHGDAFITTDQSNQAGTWNSGFKAVYHLGDGTTLSGNDSTANANHLSNFGSPAAGIGAFGAGGGLFDGSSAMYRTNPATTATDNWTLSGWMNSQDVTRSGQNLVLNGGEGVIPSGYRLSSYQSNFYGVSPAINIIGPVSHPSSNVWYKVALKKASGTWYLNKNGVDSGLTATITTNAPASIISLGALYTSVVPTFSEYLLGNLDEVRISDVVRSDDWLLQEYNNQSSPSAYYSVGSEVELISWAIDCSDDFPGTSATPGQNLSNYAGGAHIRSWTDKFHNGGSNTFVNQGDGYSADVDYDQIQIDSSLSALAQRVSWKWASKRSRNVSYPLVMFRITGAAGAEYAYMLFMLGDVHGVLTLRRLVAGAYTDLATGSDVSTSLGAVLDMQAEIDEDNRIVIRVGGVNDIIFDDSGNSDVPAGSVCFGNIAGISEVVVDVAATGGGGPTTIEADGASAGSSSCAAVGAATFAGVGSSAGTCTPTGVSGATAGSPGACAGTSTVAAVGASVIPAVAASAGSSTVAGTSSAIFASTGSSTGSSTCDAPSGATAGSAGASAGTCTVAAGGVALWDSVGSAAGTSTVAAIGAMLTAGVGASAGTSTVDAVSGAIKGSVGSSSGSASCFADGTDAAATGSDGAADGSCTVAGVGCMVFAATGASAGIASCTAPTSAIANGAGSSVGTSTVTATSQAVAAGAGSSIGACTVSGISCNIFAVVGTIAGLATVLGVGEDGAITYATIARFRNGTLSVPGSRKATLTVPGSRTATLDTAS